MQLNDILSRLKPRARQLHLIDPQTGDVGDITLAAVNGSTRNILTDTNPTGNAQLFIQNGVGSTQTGGTLLLNGKDFAGNPGGGPRGLREWHEWQTISRQ